MDKKVLHIVFIVLLVLAVPFSHMAAPVTAKVPVKQEKKNNPVQEESSQAFIQPQVFHAQAGAAHVQAPAIIDYMHCEILFPQEQIHTSASVTLLEKGTSKFFKTLFRYFIATQAP